MVDRLERLLDSSPTATLFDPNARAADVPLRARTVVVGAGVIGSAVAYHLTRLGDDDVLVVDRHGVASGSSWHAAGLVVASRGTHALAELARAAIDLYATLEEETGVDVGFTRPGSLTVARTAGRLDELRYFAAVARHHGVPADIVGPGDVPKLWPLASADGLVGALHQPLDGYVNPGLLAQALATGAHMRGATFREGVTVTGIATERGRAVGVTTTTGTIECERVVLACGLWTRDLAARAGAAVPLYPAEHVHVRSGPIAGVDNTLPVLRDLDGSLYIRHLNGALLVGAFEPDGKPISPDALAPDASDFAFGELPADWEHFASVRANAEARVPALADAGFERLLCAPESFTPDANFCLGETAEVEQLYVLAGMNSQGILFAGGAGLALAEWIVAGAPTRDLVEVDVRRFHSSQANRRYLHARTVEGLGRLYAMHWPYLQPTTARGIRRGPVYDRLVAARAAFGEQNAWERPMWFAPDGVAPVTEYSFGRQNWFEYAAAEHCAAREAVALFELSSFTKIDVAGRDALAALQTLSTRDLDVPVGRVVYTLVLTPRGGIDFDATITRVAEDRFLVITPTAAHAATLSRLRRAAAGRDASVFDATAALATLAVMGPRSRELLARITPDALDNDTFPWGTGRTIEVANGSALALRVSYVGELGWELYPTADSAADVFDAIVAAGSDLGLRLAGYHALDSLRAEKGFRHIGADVGHADDPFQAGFGFAVDRGRTGYAGCDALRERYGDSRTPDRVIRFVRLDDPEPLLYHGESVLRDGRIVGRVTSGAYGHTLGAACGMAMLRADVEPGVDFEIDVAGTRVPATLSATPLYDPAGDRMRT